MVAPGADSYRRLVLRSRRIGLREATRLGRWLVIAPHPDDESLGTGSLIAALGDRTDVAFLTDGDRSHRGAPGWSARRVADTRAAEARQALHALGMAGETLRLGWQDARPRTVATVEYARTVRQLIAHCRQRRIRALAVTWVGDPHCDHEAAALLAASVARRCGAALYQYLVWGWTLDDLDGRLRHQRLVSIDIARGRARQRRAISCHRSQMGARIFGAREGFRLPRGMIQLADRSRLLLLTGRQVDAP